MLALFNGVIHPYSSLFPGIALFCLHCKQNKTNKQKQLAKVNTTAQQQHNNNNNNSTTTTSVITCTPKPMSECEVLLCLERKTQSRWRSLLPQPPVAVSRRAGRKRHARMGKFISSITTHDAPRGSTRETTSRNHVRSRTVLATSCRLDGRSVMIR